MGRSQQTQEHLTLILVPDETAPVRRFRISRRWLRRAPVVAAVLCVLLALGVADWVRLRIDAVDVARMREKTVADADALLVLGEDMGRLERQLTRIAEFERKVRVIADLPEAMPVAEVPRLVADDEALPVRGSAPVVAGAAAGGGAAAAPGAFSEQPAEPAPSTVEEPVPLAPTTSLGLDDAAIRRITRRAEILGEQVAGRQLSYETLVSALEGKRQRLGASPSIWPTDGWVTSHFGGRVSPFTGQRQFHAGLDIAASFGTDIVAPAAGRVVFAGRKGPLGRTVILDHGFGIRTTYGHAAELFVERGARIERGQRIASVGSSGRSTGPHLHYAIALDGRSVDPADYILD